MKIFLHSKKNERRSVLKRVLYTAVALLATILVLTQITGGIRGSVPAGSSAQKQGQLYGGSFVKLTLEKGKPNKDSYILINGEKVLNLDQRECILTISVNSVIEVYNASTELLTLSVSALSPNLTLAAGGGSVICKKGISYVCMLLCESNIDSNGIAKD